MKKFIMKPMHNSLYRDELLEHYHNPHNAGKLEKPTHVYDMGNPSCGDQTVVMLEIKNGTVSKTAHESSGCALSVASASMLSDYIQNKSVDDVLKITPGELQTLVVPGETLTPSRLKCLLMPLEAFKKALQK